MATILIMTLPETGHLNPTIKISRTLKARGHRVWHSNLVDFEEYILSQGLEFVPMFEDLAPKGFTTERAIDVSPGTALLATLESKGTQDSRTVEDLVAEEMDSIIRKTGPDLLILDTYLAMNFPLLIAQIAVPCLLVGTSLKFSLLDHFPHIYDDPRFARILELPTLFLCPEEFDFSDSKKSDQHYYVEASVDFQRKEKKIAWDRVSDGKPLIYCSLGTQSRRSPEGEDNAFNQRVRRGFLRNVIGAMESIQDWQLIIAVGDHLGPDDFTAPPNVIVVSQAPQLEILKRASVIITHGGLGTIKESILLGVPMIVFPMAGDQPGNAVRVAYHRIGIKGSMAMATVSSIQAMISKICADPAYRSNVDRMSRIFRRREAEAPSVKLIESHIANQIAARI